MRSIIAILTGGATGLLTVMILGVMVLTQYPYPADLEWFDTDHRNTYLQALPTIGLWYYIIAHILGAFVAGLIASLIPIKKRFYLGCIAALPVIGYIAIDLFRHRYPDWYYVTDIMSSCAMALLGASIGSQRRV